MVKLRESRRGATSVVYKVISEIVLKCSTAQGRDDFPHENRIFDILEQHRPCPELVTSFLRLENANFLELLPGFSLSERLQQYQIRDLNSTLVRSVTKIEPLLLRERWIKALAEGTAWLESLGLAHGDLKPENILVDAQDCLKLADFDCTDFIGTEFEACIPPYGRILEDGLAGKLGARTEQFALGSLFYYIDYGFEVYSNVNFGEEHGPIVVDKLQSLEFPVLAMDAIRDRIIDNCWHGRYATIRALSQDISDKCDLKGYSPSAIHREKFAALQTKCRQLLTDGILAQTE